jgi:hypothetical protein
VDALVREFAERYADAPGAVQAHLFTAAFPQMLQEER